MKRIIAIFIAILMLLTLASCVDDQGDMGGDVHLPGVESGNNNNNNNGNTGTTVESNPSGGGSTDANGDINLPIDWFD